MGTVASTLFGHHGCVHPSDVVEIKTGRIQGKTFDFPGLPNVDCFLGIPFGKPPVGELRFKKPVPADDWEGVLDCSKFGPRCYHKDEIFELFPLTNLPTKSEDCLRLNVFVPSGDGYVNEDKEAGGRPVLVFIHGGGFCVHSSAHYGDVGMCSTICKKGVIVVTIQYRLGFFGFLSTNDAEAPGNFGLFDQALALKWVHDNIASFGGNPNNVTVCGQSAGGASADLLSLSPISRDYFQKVIPMGGNATCVFAINDGEELREACLQFAKEKGLVLDPNSTKTEQNKALLEFMRALPAHQLQIGLFGMRGHRINKGKLDLVPIIDGDFLPKPIEELRKEAPKKKCMVGATTHEGLLFAALTFVKPSVSVVDRTIRRAFHLSRNDSGPEIEGVINKVRSVYLTEDDRNDPKKLTKATIRVLGESLISYGQPLYAQAMASNGHEVYFYSFDYDRSGRFGLIARLIPFIGATHGTELPYLLGKGVVANFHPDDEDRAMIDVFTTLFANFCRYGDPNGKSEVRNWETHSLEQPYRYYSIDHPKCEMKEEFENRTAEIWKEAFETMKSIKAQKSRI
ncbi:hypothetical protein QR680_008483 [Steinernema hermaphroditum]|uniref:Carboxylic ester hydrolase n=1 Tax=Steinernema hermaphroditum TaxID=289476 RepID=A0AA39IGS3_9BILA|nr:hypothetical protein QR680_008483 [Steinernema hermaphroditum]